MWYSARVMMQLFRIISLFVCLIVVPPMSLAEEEPAAAKPIVVEMLSKASYLTKKKPNLKAKYFMFLRSASWCVPCKMIVPKLMKDYGKMKGAQMEMILLGQEDEATVKNYMKEHKFKCPGVMSLGGAIPGLDFGNFGFPSTCIVTADGQFVANGGGVGMYEWKKQLKAFQAGLRKQKKQQEEE